MVISDSELLQRYAREGSEDAFAQLVHRHVNMVYSAALRQVGRAHLAQEVSQTVFIELARCAHKLRSDSIPGAWLYEVTRRRAIDVVRSESRRRQREQTSHDLEIDETREPDWSEIAPLLDEAMQELSDQDRRAVFLRFFEDKSLREVGGLLGISEDTAQKRISRALDALRVALGKRKRPLGAAGLAAALSAQAVASAPAGLAASISGAAFAAGAALHTAAAVGAAQAITMTTLQKTLITAALALSIGTGLYEARQVSRLQREIAALARGQADERAEAAARVAELLAENARLRGDAQRLRAEAERMGGASAGEATEVAANATLSAMAAWLERVEKLKERLRVQPEAGIPELKLLTDEDWLSATKGTKLGTEAEFRRVLSELRGLAENRFAQTIRQATEAFKKSSGRAFPTDSAELGPYLSPPADVEMLQRWVVLPADEVRSIDIGEDLVITQRAAIDDEYDQRTVIGAKGGMGSSGRGFTPEVTILPVLNQAYRAANPGKPSPDDLNLLAPYATTPEQQAGLRRMIDKRARAGQDAEARW